MAGYLLIQGSHFRCCHTHIALPEGKKKKSRKGRSTFLFAGAFGSLASLFSILQARAAIGNQMNSQLLPSNSISGGKQKPATVAGRKRGRGRRGFGRKLFLSSFPQGRSPGRRDCALEGRGGGLSSPPTLVARGCIVSHRFGWVPCAPTFPTYTWHFPLNSFFDFFFTGVSDRVWSLHF